MERDDPGGAAGGSRLAPVGAGRCSLGHGQRAHRSHRPKWTPLDGRRLEATISGVHRLAGLDIPFPVFDWNDIALHARALGALVWIAELDPVRALEAQHHGCRVVLLAEGLESCSIVVTATGREGVVGPVELRRLRAGAILANVGHSNREIDVDWLERQSGGPVRRLIDRYTIDGRDVFLVNRGSLVNLAPGAGIAIDELFDSFAGIMLRGPAWLLEGGAASSRPGLQSYPAELEREIAEPALTSRS